VSCILFNLCLLEKTRPDAPQPPGVRARRAVVSSSRARRMSRTKSNASVALALGAFASATFAFPLWYCYAPSKSMWTQEESLSVAAVRRGAFMNSGSRDVGLDGRSTTKPP